jgi:hypothetical protein
VSAAKQSHLFAQTAFVRADYYIESIFISGIRVYP